MTSRRLKISRASWAPVNLSRYTRREPIALASSNSSNPAAEATIVWWALGHSRAPAFHQLAIITCLEAWLETRILCTRPKLEVHILVSSSSRHQIMYISYPSRTIRLMAWPQTTVSASTEWMKSFYIKGQVVVKFREVELITTILATATCWSQPKLQSSRFTNSTMANSSNSLRMVKLENIKRGLRQWFNNLWRRSEICIVESLWV